MKRRVGVGIPAAVSCDLAMRRLRIAGPPIRRAYARGVVLSL
jgi:hypothetical protein